MQYEVKRLFSETGVHCDWQVYTDESGPRVGVIGAGMVGVCAASWLQRDGHSVFLIERDEPGHGASFGNAGCFNGSSVTPVAMPGVVWNVPGWLFDPLAPLALRWNYMDQDFYPWSSIRSTLRQT
jgi:D-amino-acid dehydrogenase